MQHEGCRSARACATLSPPRWTHAAAAAQGRTQSTAAAQQQHSSPGAVRLHSQNAHSSALLARWARPMCTAVTARSGAPFAQTVSLLQRTPASRRIPAPKGAITCSPAQRRKILSSASRGSNPRERRQQVNDIGARANGLLISMPAMLWAAAERGARGTVVAHGEPRTDRLFSVREVGGRGGRGRPGSHHISTVASVPSRVGCGSRSEAVERCVFIVLYMRSRASIAIGPRKGRSMGEHARTDGL